MKDFQCHVDMKDHSISIIGERVLNGKKKNSISIVVKVLKLYSIEKNRVSRNFQVVLDKHVTMF